MRFVQTSPLHEFHTQPVPCTYDSGGLRLSYLDWGGEGTTLIFLHGGALNAHTWDVVCDLLHEGFRCVALDLRGHGDSEWSREMCYPTADHVTDLAKLIDVLGVRDVVLIGNSLGGRVALTYVGTHPTSVTALALIDFGPRRPRVTGRQRPGNGRVRHFIAEQTEAASLEEFIDRAIAFNPSRTREQLRRSLAFSLRRTPSGMLTWKYDPNILRQPPGYDMTAEMASLWDAAGRVACPTLVVRGSMSDVFLDEDAESLARQLPNGTWQRIEGAGHTIQGDRPYALAECLFAFINRVTGLESAL